jgi:hypothetical protein
MKPPERTAGENGPTGGDSVSERMAFRAESVDMESPWMAPLQPRVVAATYLWYRQIEIERYE